ncbi:MAG: MlaC/ttg2D family ABC transporter substrate-binding protein [Halorhodospira sp.]
MAVAMEKGMRHSRLKWIGVPTLALVLMWAVVGGVAAQPSSPHALVEEITDEVLGVLEEQGEALTEDPVAFYETLAPIVEPHIAYDRIGARMLGPHWRDADEQTRERFVQEFQRSLLRSYASSLEDYQGVEVRILGSRRRDSAVQVGMEVGSGDDRARLLYQLEEIDGAWKLVDVTAEGVSLVHNYREDFRAQLRDKDLEAVIEEMAERNREIGFE